jgi:hypothetical protein
MTSDEMAFFALTEKAWGIQANTCSSHAQFASAVGAKMRAFRLPTWCLREVDEHEAFDAAQKYIELVQLEGPEAHKKATEIGKIASFKPDLADKLQRLLQKENCQKGMMAFLRSFEGGKILELAKAIGAESNVLEDVGQLFEVKYSCLWDRPTGEDEIRKLLTVYGTVKESNAILNASAHSLQEAFREWRERLKFIGVSGEALKAKFLGLAKFFDALLKIYKQEEILPEQLKAFHAEIIGHKSEIADILNSDRKVFAEAYGPYLEGLSDDEIASVKSKIGDLFGQPKTECNAKVRDVAEKFRKNQLKSKLFSLWTKKTGTKSPQDWSNRYRVPILCCVPEPEYESAKRAFDALNRNGGTDAEIKAAIEFIESSAIFECLSDESRRSAAFERGVIGQYLPLLPDAEKVREALDRLSVDVYEWQDSPGIKNKIRQLAEAEYNAGGSDKALLKIDEMDDAQSKQYLKRLVKDSMSVGIEILAEGRE